MTSEEKKAKAESNAYRVLMDMKIFRIITEISKAHDLSLEKAMDIFYNTHMADMIKDKVADLHCRSDKYLAQCVWDEYTENRNDLTP